MNNLNGVKKMNNKLKFGLAITLPAALLSGCAGTPKWQKHQENLKNSEDEFKAERNRSREKVDRNGEVVDDYYINTRSIEVSKNTRANLPSLFYQPVNKFYDGLTNINTISTDIFKDNNLIVEFVDNSVTTGGSGKVSKNNNAIANALMASQAAPINSFDMKPPSANGEDVIIDDTEGKQEDGERLLIDYTGDLKGYLDYIAIKKNMKWKYDNENNKVYFYTYETQTFVIYGLSEEITSDSSISTDASTSSSGSGSSSTSGNGESNSKNEQTIKFKSKQKNWDEVVSTVKNMLSADGRMALNSTQGKITATDHDYILSKINKYIDSINLDAKKEVNFDVKVINLKLTDQRNIGVNVNWINDKLNINLGANSAVTGAGSIIGFANNGDKALLNILDELGTARVSNKINTTTINNMPVPIQVTTNQSYIKQTSVQSNGESGTDFEQVETAVIPSGITMNLTPRVVKQDILLNYSVNISSLDSLDTAPGDSKIQLPITSVKNFVQRVSLKNGQPKVVAAFERQDTKTGKKKPIIDSLWFLGGNESFDDQKEIILIVITPYVN